MSRKKQTSKKYFYGFFMGMGIRINSVKNQELFCQQYWNKVLAGKTKQYDHLSQEFDLHGINYYLLAGLFPMNENSLNKIISTTDKELKLFKPTKKALTLWRGIRNPKPYDNKIFLKKFDKCKDLKEGDILTMPEYAYAAENKQYAEFYASYKDGILYEINVPKGSKIGDSHFYIFPRASKFKCKGNELVENDRVQYHHIKLDYIPPENPFKRPFEKLKGIFKNLN